MIRQVVSHISVSLVGLGLGVQMALPRVTSTDEVITITEHEVLGSEIRCLQVGSPLESPEFYRCFHAEVWEQLQRKMR